MYLGGKVTYGHQRLCLWTQFVMFQYLWYNLSTPSPFPAPLPLTCTRRPRSKLGAGGVVSLTCSAQVYPVQWPQTSSVLSSSKTHNLLFFKRPSQQYKWTLSGWTLLTLTKWQRSKETSVLKWLLREFQCAQFLIRAHFCKNRGGIRADY